MPGLRETIYWKKRLKPKMQGWKCKARRIKNPGNHERQIEHSTVVRARQKGWQTQDSMVSKTKAERLQSFDRKWQDMGRRVHRDTGASGKPKTENVLGDTDQGE